jgi:hypothetical protein
LRWRLNNAANRSGDGEVGRGTRAVSQHAVERTIGKLVTDDDFRGRFFENPAAATWEAGLRLSPVELQALSGLSRAAIARFSQSLDGRIRRLCLLGKPSPAPRRKPGLSSERFDGGAEGAR